MFIHIIEWHWSRDLLSQQEKYTNASSHAQNDASIQHRQPKFCQSLSIRVYAKYIKFNLVLKAARRLFDSLFVPRQRGVSRLTKCGDELIWKDIRRREIYTLCLMVFVRAYVTETE